jgi:hypothetical protein
MSEEALIGFSLEEFDVILNRVVDQVEDLQGVIRDTDEEAEKLEAKVDVITETSINKLRRALRFSRRVAGTVRAVLVTTGGATSQIYGSLLDATLLTAELLIDIATAESFTLVGGAQAALKFQMAFKLIQKAEAIRAQDMETAAQIEREIAIISPWTYGLIIHPLIVSYAILIIIELMRLLNG